MPALLSVCQPVAAEGKKLGVVTKLACLFLFIKLTFFFQMRSILDNDFVLLHEPSEQSPLRPLARECGTIKLQNTLFHGGRFPLFEQQFHHVGSFSRSLKDGDGTLRQLSIGPRLKSPGLSVTDNSFRVWAHTCGSQRETL